MWELELGQRGVLKRNKSRGMDRVLTFQLLTYPTTFEVKLVHPA